MIDWTDVHGRVRSQYFFADPDQYAEAWAERGFPLDVVHAYSNSALL